MVPNPYGLYDDGVRSRTLWALREGLIVGGILLFWVVVAIALTVVLFVLSIPFALVHFTAPGLPVAGLVWTLVGPLAFLNASLYVLVRGGTVIVDHYRTGDGLTFDPATGANETVVDGAPSEDAESTSGVSGSGEGSAVGADGTADSADGTTADADGTAVDAGGSEDDSGG